MTPEERLRLQRVEALLSQLVKSDRYTIEKRTQILDGRNIQTGKTTGTKLPEASNQLFGMWGKTPVDQPAAIADVAGGLSDSDGTARAKINSVIAALREVGIIAT